MKKCPYCNEEIQDEAIKCRYCGEMLDKKGDSFIEKLAEEKDRLGSTRIKCPRCGYKGNEGEFTKAYDTGTFCCLLLIMILPAILYYFFRYGKRICPKCHNIF